jgi:hypothetical protein
MTVIEYVSIGFAVAGTALRIALLFRGLDNGAEQAA